MLREISVLIRTNTRNDDLSFRYGGDEFAILLPRCGINIATRVADKLVRLVAKHSFSAVDGSDLGKVTISCGVASQAEGHQGLVEMADDCLFAAKRAGKGLVKVNQ